MTISQAWSLSFVAVALVASRPSLADFSFSLEPQTIQPGERATLTLRLPEKDLLAQTASEEDFPEAHDEWLIKTENLELLDQDYRKEKGNFVWRYQVTAYSAGEIAIPPISVTLGPQSFSSERTVLKVVSPRNPEDGELRPDAGEVSTPWSPSFWLGLVSALAFATALFFYLKLRFTKPAPPAAAEEAPPLENPVDWLRKQLLILRAKLDTPQDHRHSPDAWSSIVREFAQRQSHSPVLAWTTTEMGRRLQDPKFLELVRILRECDQFKFTQHPQRGNEAKLTLHWIEESERALL